MRHSFLVLLALSVPAAAQQQQVRPNVDEPSKESVRPVQTEKKAAGAADASRAAAPEQGGEVVYADVLKNPDDIELNRRYAQQQIRKGDLRGASSTLERLSMLRSGDASVRLLHGVVLFRLDDAVAAERELEAVLAMPDLPERVRAEAADYLARARARQKNAHFDARVTVGFGYDDNVNAAPDGDVVLFNGNPLVLQDGSRRKEDANIQLIGSLGAAYDFGGPKGHTVFGRFTTFRGEQHVYDTLDLQAYSVETGTILRLGRGLELRPTFSFDHVLLSQSTFLRSRNLGLRADKRVSRSWSFFGEFAHSDQDFVDTPQIRTAQQRDGGQFDLEGGASWLPGPADRLTFTLRHRRKFSRAVSDAYRREGAGLEWTHLFRKGVFTVFTIDGQFDRYEEADAFVDRRVVRHDDAGRFELLAGAPMSLIWAPMRAFTATVGYEHYRQGSTIRNYDYTNNRLSFLVTYLWGN